MCFRNYLGKQQEKTTSDVPKALIVSDFRDTFPLLSKIAGIMVACPVGTAGVERSFSTMNRLCSKLRQRMTQEHLSSLLLISQEGPAKPNRKELMEIVYIWYIQKTRRIQLPTHTSELPQLTST